MDFAVDISCEMKVNRNCDLCRQKVTELMHSVQVVYSVDFVGADNSIKLKARANPNIVLAVIERYGEHGKLSSFHIGGEIVNARGGGYYTQSGYYLPSSNAAANYPYPSPYAPPPPHAFAGNCAYPMSNPPCKTEAPRQMNNQHTAAPPFNYAPPPPRPLYSSCYVEPPYWPSSSSGGGRCVIM